MHSQFPILCFMPSNLLLHLGKHIDSETLLFITDKIERFRDSGTMLEKENVAMAHTNVFCLLTQVVALI